MAEDSASVESPLLNLCRWMTNRGNVCSPADIWHRPRFCRTITHCSLPCEEETDFCAGMDRVDGCSQRSSAPQDQAQLSPVSYVPVSLWTRGANRDADIKNVTVNKREATFEYQDVYQTRLHEGSSVHQHHQLRKRFREITKLDWGELAIILPKLVKVEPQVHIPRLCVC